uniref:Uncharacterized protein n=1 Tax=Arundo donax TaxID=35708 RepID=A0A0A9CUZ9_ARUDO
MWTGREGLYDDDLVWAARLGFVVVIPSVSVKDRTVVGLDEQSLNVLVTC